MNQQDDIQELNCSVCMCAFSAPVTIQCGHTFCRFCLLNSIKNKNSCPICRTPLTNLPERPKQDETIFNIVNEMKKSSIQKVTKSKQQPLEMMGREVKSLLLIDIRTKDVLLPFTKVTATFQLQSPTLLTKLQKFVARQESPFNQYGITAKICALNQLRYNVYECIIEGKHFCKIEEEWIDKGTDYEREFFFKLCNVQEVSQYSEIPINSFDKFFILFSKVKEQQVLQSIGKLIDSHVLIDRNDPVALFYSILRILKVPNELKYSEGIRFFKQGKIDWLIGHLDSIDYDVGKNVNKFLIGSNKNFKAGSLLLFALVICFVILFHGVGEL